MNELAWALPGAAGVVAGAVGLAAVSWLSWATISPTHTLWGPVYYRCAASTACALTFDDGPTSPHTDHVLDILGELNVQAAFFVIGRNARGATPLLKRMHREGHIIANHSFDHSHLGMLRGRRYWDSQIERTNEVIADAIGRRPAMFRPPMGMKTWYAMQAAARHGQAVITWSRRAVDGIPTTPQRIVSRLEHTTKGGEVLLLHDGREPQAMGDRQATVEAIRPLILGLRRRGLQLLRVDRLLNLPAYAPECSGARSA